MSRNLLIHVQRLAVIVALAVPFAAVAHAQQWKTQSFPQNQFRISSPVALEVENDNMDAEHGFVPIATYSGNFATSELMVLVCDCVAQFSGGDAEQALAKVQEYTLDLAGAHLISSKKVALNGHPGRETISQNDARSFAIRTFVVGKTLYTVIVAYPNGEPDGAQTARHFLDSFEFLPASGK